MRKELFISLVFFSKLFFAQAAPSKYWIQFKDKTGTPYFIDNPSAFLSQRSIDRRTKQSISVKENDLPVNPSYIDSVLSFGVSLINTSKWFNAITISTTDTNKINTIKALSFVSGSEPVGMSKTKNRETFSPVTYYKTSQPRRINNLDYGPSLNQLSMIGGDCLHDLGYYGQGVEIAVIDAGYINVESLPAFDSLRINNQIISTWDFVAGDSSVYELDDHGTFVLSIMAGNLPGEIIGTAPKANYYLLRSEQDPSEYIIEEDNWVSAAEYADSAGADVINSSLGYNTFDDPSQNHAYSDMNGNTTRITIAADIAASKGMIVVSSAGNEGNSSWQYITAPADADSIIAVGAVDANGSYVGFSSRGPTYDGRIKPDIATLGSGVVIASVLGGIQTGNGTSFASPIAAGMVACLWQANPTKRNTEIIEAIKQSANQHNNPDNLIGYGIPNFCIANSLLKGINPIVFEADSILSLSPNPFLNEIEVVFYSDTKQTLQLKIVDVTGRTVLEEERKMVNNSYNNFKLSKLESLNKGVYILTIVGENKGYKYKMIKQ